MIPLTERPKEYLPNSNGTPDFNIINNTNYKK